MTLPANVRYILFFILYDRANSRLPFPQLETEAVYGNAAFVGHIQSLKEFCGAAQDALHSPARAKTIDCAVGPAR